MATEMDMATHDALIEKMEIGGGASASVPLKLRLADLYADRSRLKQLKEEEKDNCNACLGSVTDRQKGLKLYRQIFDRLSGDEQLRAYQQIAQSYVLLNQKTQVHKFNRSIINNRKYSKKLKALVYLHEAEEKFLGQKYAAAYTDFRRAINRNSALYTPLTRYRMAWCEFNAGKYSLARRHLKDILASKAKMDSQLRNDVAKDFAKFTAKGPIHSKQLKEIHHLSEKSLALENIELLATELDRLGRAKENLDANLYIIENFDMRPIDKAFAYLRMAMAEQTLKRDSQTISHFTKSTAAYAEVDCKELEFRCNEYAEKSKKFLVFWNKVEKDHPTATLAQVWKLYLAAFNDAYDMHYVAAQMFDVRKSYPEAVNHYIASAKIIKKRELVEKEKKLFVASLDASMSSAETSKNNELKKKAYTEYLVIDPKGPKHIHAKYQLAYLEYDEKQYKAALKSFKKVIAEVVEAEKVQKGHTAIAKKAADLVLDIYALQKNNRKIMKHAKLYVGTFPQHKKDFESVYRKALLNESIAAIDKDASESTRKELLTLMVAVPFADVDEKEQILMLKTQIQLARSVKDLAETIRTGKKLLRYKKLPLKTSHFAYDNLVWAYQVSFNFRQAYIYEKRRLDNSRLAKIDLIRLAMLAEMAGINPKKYYEEYLTRNHGVLEGNRIRAKIVQGSRVPWAEIKKTLFKTKGSPLLLSELALETFGQYKNIKGAEQVLEGSNADKKPAGKVLLRHVQIPHFKSMKAKLARHRISRQAHRTGADTAKRMQLIDELEEFTNAAIDRGDFPLHVAGLSVLQIEKQRLVKDLNSLPVPKGLSADQRKQYQLLMADKTKGFTQEAQAIQKTLKTLWANEKYIDEKTKERENASVHIENLIADEAQFLAEYAPENKKSKLQALGVAPSGYAAKLKQARQQAKAHPFKIEAIEKLRQLEGKMAHHTHVAFLDQRLLEMKGKVTP